MRIRRPLQFTLIALVAALAACGRPEEPPLEAPTPAGPPAPRVVEVTATYDAEEDQHRFVTDVEEIPPGWTTFRLINGSSDVHFLIVELLPPGKGIEDSLREAVPVFQEAMDLIDAGRAEEGFAKLDELPEWFGELRFMGGPGLIIPGKSAEATVHLEPGTYLMECYIKTVDGKFHSSMGMLREFTVVGEPTGAVPPDDIDLEMTLTNEGFGIEGDPAPGRNRVAVHFAEEKPPFLGNDVHLVQLSDELTVEEAAAWMDWSRPDGLVSDPEAGPLPRFLGGTHEAPFGSTVYFTVELTPGRYAWVSERPADQPLYEEFAVAAP